MGSSALGKEDDDSGCGAEQLPSPTALSQCGQRTEQPRGSQPSSAAAFGSREGQTEAGGRLELAHGISASMQCVLFDLQKQRAARHAARLLQRGWCLAGNTWLCMKVVLGTSSAAPLQGWGCPSFHPQPVCSSKISGDGFVVCHGTGATGLSATFNPHWLCFGVLGLSSTQWAAAAAPCSQILFPGVPDGLAVPSAHPLAVLLQEELLHHSHKSPKAEREIWKSSFACIFSRLI